MVEDLKSLDKDGLVDLLVQYNEEFAKAFLSCVSSEELNRLKEEIILIQKEIMSRSVDYI